MVKILRILLCMILLVGCHQKEISVADVHGIENIGYSELMEHTQASEYFVMYIGRYDCRDCCAFYPYLEDYVHIHDKIGVYALDVKVLLEDAKKKDASKEEKAFARSYAKELNLDWVPCIQVISDGEVIAQYEYKTKESLKEFYKFMNTYCKEIE